MQIKKGTVKYPANDRTFTSKYSNKPQQTILIIMEDGTEERIYFDQGRSPHASLTKGQEVSIVYSQKDGKNIRQLVVDNVTSTNNSPKPSNNTNNTKSTPATTDYLNEQLDVFSAVYKVVHERLSVELGFGNEDCRAVTTSFLIEGNRKGIDFKALLKDEVNDDPSKEDSDDFVF